MSDDPEPPWWEPADDEAPRIVGHINSPLIDLIRKHAPWNKDDALALGDQLWAVVEPGDFDTAKAVRVRERV